MSESRPFNGWGVAEQEKRRNEQLQRKLDKALNYIRDTECCSTCEDDAGCPVCELQAAVNEEQW